MQPEIHAKKVRINVQVPIELKERLSYLSALHGKKISALVRQSIEEKLDAIEEAIFEEELKCAYEELAGENIEISEDFKYVDAEHL